MFERLHIDGKTTAAYYTPGPLAPELKRLIPEIEYASGSLTGNKATFEIADKIIKEEGGFADSDYFKLFSYPLLQGSPVSALGSPVSMAISESMARQFFGSAAAALGKTIRYDNKKDLSVTAVFADCPRNSSQKFDYLINWSSVQELYPWTKKWGTSGPQTYLALKAGADPMAVRTKIKKFLDGYNKDQSASFRIELDLQPFGEGYLHSNFKDGQTAGGRIEYVRLLA